MTRTSPVRKVQCTRTFDSDYKRLPDEIRNEVDQALRDLVKDPMPRRLRFEKLAGHRRSPIFTIHATRNHSYKISFKLCGNTAVLRRVARHKTIDRGP